MRASKLCLVLSLILLASCGQQNGASGDGHSKPLKAQHNHTKEGRLRHHAQPKLLLQSNDESLGEVEAFYMDDVAYVPLVHTLQLLDFEVKEEQEEIKAGFSDEYIVLKHHSNKAMIEGKADTLPMSLTKREGHVLIAVPSLKEILGMNTRVQTVNGTLMIVTENDAQQYGFSETESLGNLYVQQGSKIEHGTEVSTSADIVREAEKYLGTEYEFGAKAGQSDTFDSSSFVQYVFKQNGIELPRLTRNMAKLGIPVSVQELQPGDVLYFYWPGRFESSKIVGHVGIYIGNGRMIHASPIPLNGVQIENFLDLSSMFRDTFVGAKRYIE